MSTGHTNGWFASVIYEMTKLSKQLAENYGYFMNSYRLCRILLF